MIRWRRTSVSLNRPLAAATTITAIVIAIGIAPAVANLATLRNAIN
jgi:hypothetical protein